MYQKKDWLMMEKKLYTSYSFDCIFYMCYSLENSHDIFLNFLW